MTFLKDIKGFHHFIADLRCAKTREAEKHRVKKELGKIRINFARVYGNNGQDITKGIWKLIYCWMLGYDVDIGHIEAVKLVASKNHLEKVTGYLGCALLLEKNCQMINLVTNSVRRDLRSRCIFTASLALNFLANTNFDEILDHVFHDVSRLIFPHISNYLQQKAYIVLVQFLRRRPSLFSNTDVWFKKKIQIFRHSPYASPLMTMFSFLREFFLHLHHKVIDSEEWFQAHLCLLKGIVTNGFSESHRKGKMNNSFLLIEAMRFTQCFASFTGITSLLTTLELIVETILQHLDSLCFISSNDEETREPKAKTLFKIEYAVLFEVTNVLVAFKDHSINPSLHSQTVNLLIKVFYLHDPDPRLLCLDCFSRMAIFPEMSHVIFTHVDAILSCLYQPDWSMGYFAANVLFFICTEHSYQVILESLREFLTRIPNEPDEGELTIKILLLMQRYSKGYVEFVDGTFSLLDKVRDSVGEKIWGRLIQIITTSDKKHRESHRYFAKRAYRRLLNSLQSNETLVRVACYLVGEFGFLLTKEVSPEDQLTILGNYVPTIHLDHRGIVFTAVLKLMIRFPRLKEQGLHIMDPYLRVQHIALQQQASDYIGIMKTVHPNVLPCLLTSQEKCFQIVSIPKLCTSFPSTGVKPEIEGKETCGVDGNDEISKDNHHLCETFDKSCRAAESESEGGTKWPLTENENLSFPGSPNSKKEDTNVTINSPGSLVSYDLSAFDLWFRLCISTGGLLCSKSPVRIMVKQQYDHGIGRLLLLWTNEAQEILILNSVCVEATNSLSVRQVYNPLKQGSYRMKARGGIMKHALEIRIVNPFNYPPRYSCSGHFYPSEQPFTLHTALPVRLTSFISPEPFPNMSSTEDDDLSFRRHTKSSTGSSELPVEKYRDKLSMYFNNSFHLKFLSTRRCVRGRGKLFLHALNHDALPILCDLSVEVTHGGQWNVMVSTDNALVTQHLLNNVSSYLLSNEIQNMRLWYNKKTINQDSSLVPYSIL